MSIGQQVSALQVKSISYYDDQTKQDRRISHFSSRESLFMQDVMKAFDDS